MKKWTEDELINAGYRIENAKITKVDLSMEDHGCLTLELTLEGKGRGCCYGAMCQVRAILTQKMNSFLDVAGMESIIRIMDIVGVSCFNYLTNSYVRVATKGWGNPIKIIGNLIKDKWFDQESFFEDKNND